MEYKEYCLNLLKKLVAIPSESQNEEEIARFLYSHLEEIGMDVKLQHVSGNSYNVIGKIKGEGYRKKSKKLLLGGHIDTVTPSRKWTTNPYSLIEDGDKLYGLGAGDMKGGLAAQLTAIKMFIDNGLDFAGEIEFVGLADEERHSIGAYAYVKEKKKNNDIDFAVFAEPHFNSIIVGATGKILLKLIVNGKTGHAAIPESGVNAIDCMAELLSVFNKEYTPLYEKGKIGSFSVLQIGNPTKGYSLSIPDLCYAFLNKQLIDKESIDSFINNLEQLYKEHVKRGIFSIEKEIPCYNSYEINNKERYLLNLLDIIAGLSYKLPDLKVNQSVSDGNIIYDALGIPIILFGPKGIDIHKENECLLKSTLFTYMEILEHYLISFYLES